MSEERDNDDMSGAAASNLRNSSSIAAPLACSSVSSIVSPPIKSVNGPCSAAASQRAKLSQLTPVEAKVDSYKEAFERQRSPQPASSIFCR